MCKMKFGCTISFFWQITLSSLFSFYSHLPVYSPVDLLLFLSFHILFLHPTLYLPPSPHHYHSLPSPLLFYPILHFSNCLPLATTTVSPSLFYLHDPMVLFLNCSSLHHLLCGPFPPLLSLMSFSIPHCYLLDF